MRKEPDYERQSGGAEVHVKDCYVWAEIQYLDSTTNYKECLRSGTPNSSDELTIEDERTGCRLDAVSALTFVGFLVCIFLALITRQ